MLEDLTVLLSNEMLLVEIPWDLGWMCFLLQRIFSHILKLEDNSFTMLCLVSAIQQCESVIVYIYLYIYTYVCMYVYILSLLSLPPTLPHPIPLDLHRAPSWISCPVQQLSTSYLFHAWWCIYVHSILPIQPALAFLTVCLCVHSLCLSLFWPCK